MIFKNTRELLAEKNFEEFNNFSKNGCQNKRSRKKSEGKPIKTKFTMKEKVICTASELISETERELKRMIDTYHKRHQHKTFNAIKTTSMNEN